MTGFCKAASAAGVDPQALAQYAMSKRTEKQAQESGPRFKTDGWVPPDVTDKNRDLFPTSVVGHKPGFIPMMIGTPGEGVVNTDPIASLAADQVAKAIGAYSSPKDPRERSWFGAHTNALEQLSKVLTDKAVDPRWSDAPYDPVELKNMYDHFMDLGTNTANRVVSPKK